MCEQEQSIAEISREMVEIYMREFEAFCERLGVTDATSQKFSVREYHDRDPLDKEIWLENGECSVLLGRIWTQTTHDTNVSHFHVYTAKVEDATQLTNTKESER